MHILELLFLEENPDSLFNTVSVCFFGVHLCLNVNALS